MSSLHIPKGDILIVDDTPANLRLLAGMLSQQSYKVRPVPNGKMALTAARSAPPDLILLDINMPDMNGYEVCQHLKEDPRTRNVPVIFISALGEALDKVKAFSIGGVDYITKPYQLEEVMARVEHQITIHRLQQQLEHQVAELQALTSHLQRELELARNIQQGFLPPPIPDWDDIQVVCYSMPARAMGGDFYAYHALDTHCYIVAVGDVSGKGMPAALLMSASVASFRSLVEDGLEPGAFLMRMDHEIADYTRTTGQNCAFVYAAIQRHASQSTYQRGDHATYTVRVANAGCVTPLVKRGDGSVIWIDVGGIPLGIGLGAATGYEEARFTLTQGDLLVLTTDGVVEAMDADRTMFGFERLEAAVMTGPQSSAEAMLCHLRSSVEAFVGETEPHDDITIVVVQA